MGQASRLSPDLFLAVTKRRLSVQPGNAGQDPLQTMREPGATPVPLNNHGLICPQYVEFLRVGGLLPRTRGQGP